MNSVDVNDNIQVISSNIKSLKEELLRLEGSLRVFENLKSVGVKNIEIKNENLLNNKEVIDNVQGTEQ